MKRTSTVILSAKTFTRYYHRYEDGSSLVEDVKTKFDDWLEVTGIKSSFAGMNPKDRMRVFLSWKWGSEDATANFACESSRRDALSRITLEFLSNCGEYTKEFWQRVIYWEEQCNKIKSKHGLPIFNIPASNKQFSCGEEVKVMSLDDLAKEVADGTLFDKV